MFSSNNDDDPLSPYDHSDLASSNPDPIFGPSASKSASEHKLVDNPLNLDHNGKPLTYRTAIQGPNNWIEANSAKFRRLIQKMNTMHPTMHNKLPLDRKHDVTYYNPITKTNLPMVCVTFEFEE